MKNYKYIFGPVASRRFGMSLGIDLSPDKKRCNFDCIYCELEAAKPITSYDNPPKVDEIINEVKEAIKTHTFDVLTITSNGEPTLYPYLNELIDKLIPLNKKLLILSNSSTIMKKDIQSALKKLDIVKLSLDAITPIIFKKIDRPAKGIDINEIINGIIDFRKIYDKELIIEVLVVKGINDKVEEFKKLNEVLKKIKPNRVDISTIDRPPAYKVEGVSIERLFELASYIENQNIFIPTRDKINFKIENMSKEELLNTLKKRPFSESDVKNIFDEHTQKIFNDLLKENLLEEVWVGGVKFYKAYILRLLMKEVLNLIRIFIAIDIGVVVFCYLEDNQIWLYNTQIAFFSSALIIIGSFIGYSNMVKSQIKNGNVGEDVLKKYEDKFDLYDEEDNINKDELKEYKNKKLKWYEAIIFSFKGFNIIKILGYVFLIAGFLWLKNVGIFDVISFLFGVSIVPAVSLIYLFLRRKSS